jgi:hypothetical protein
VRPETLCNASRRSLQLRRIAARIAEALSPRCEEVVLTGSVSRGVADELSDIEMLIVTSAPLGLGACFDEARRSGLEHLDTWGPQGTEVSRVFGYFEQVPVELVWWPRDYAEATVAAMLTGGSSSAAEALVNGIALRPSGVLARWQDQLREYPEALAAARVEDAALTWGGFHPTGFLTLARPGERLALVERLVDDSERVLQIVYAVNRVWQPSTKRLADRVQELAITPVRLAERIDEALTASDAVPAMLLLTGLQIDTAALAPSGPNIDRARRWLPAVRDVLREAISRGDSTSARS